MIHSDAPFFDSLRDVSWGKQHKPRQMSELYAPSKKDPLTEILDHYTEGILTNPWLTVLIKLGRTLRKSSPKEIFVQLKSRFNLEYHEQQATPLQQVLVFLNWLNQEQDQGILKRCSIGFGLIVNIDGAHLWSCRVGSNGILLGNPSSLRFASTDSRWAEMERRSPGTLRKLPSMSHSDLVRNILSPVDFNNPHKYEAFLTELRGDTIVLVLGQGALPFGPLPTSPLDISEIWSLDAGWKHGIPAHGVIIGEIEPSRVGWPHDYRIVKD